MDGRGARVEHEIFAHCDVYLWGIKLSQNGYVEGFLKSQQRRMLKDVENEVIHRSINRYDQSKNNAFIKILGMLH